MASSPAATATNWPVKNQQLVASRTTENAFWMWPVSTCVVFVWDARDLRHLVCSYCWLLCRISQWFLPMGFPRQKKKRGQGKLWSWNGWLLLSASTQQSAVNHKKCFCRNLVNKEQLLCAEFGHADWPHLREIHKGSSFTNCWFHQRDGARTGCPVSKHFQNRFEKKIPWFVDLWREWVQEIMHGFLCLIPQKTHLSCGQQKRDGHRMSRGLLRTMEPSILVPLLECFVQWYLLNEVHCIEMPETFQSIYIQVQFDVITWADKAFTSRVHPARAQVAWPSVWSTKLNDSGLFSTCTTISPLDIYFVTRCLHFWWHCQRINSNKSRKQIFTQRAYFFVTTPPPPHTHTLRAPTCAPRQVDSTKTGHVPSEGF